MLITSLQGKLICSPEVQTKTALVIFDPEEEELVQVKAADMSVERVSKTLGPSQLGLQHVPQQFHGVQLKTLSNVKQGTWTWEARRAYGPYPQISLIKLPSNHWLLGLGEAVVVHLAAYDPEAPLFEVGAPETPTTAWERLLDG
jgi:hypothetical protein